ncbi:MAG: HAD hydrolase family protein [Thermodesulfobacteriota bacterium]|nr:HAD hydrolase family protein [Thermodesulfobacteriota bacterium]
MIMPANTEQLQAIKLLLLDVDGVLTDGTVIYNENRSETKCFSVKDGLGIRMLIKAGIPVGIVTGRASAALKRRCRELGITPLLDGISDKTAVIKDIVASTPITSLKEAAFMGDDLPDIPLMAYTGMAIAVADAHPAVIERADMVTRNPGGRGAVREVCEAILKAQGRWDEATSIFLGTGKKRD